MRRRRSPARTAGHMRKIRLRTQSTFRAVQVPERAFSARGGLLNWSLDLGGFQGGRVVNFWTDVSPGSISIASKMGPKLLQNRPREAPKTLLEPGCRWKLFFDLFWPRFWIPRNLKNRALA